MPFVRRRRPYAFVPCRKKRRFRASYPKAPLVGANVPDYVRLRQVVERKRFFFEKKNQKTFVTVGCGSDRAKSRRTRSFFASFFSKKEALA
jgi:hypothetical protein